MVALSFSLEAEECSANENNSSVPARGKSNTNWRVCGSCWAKLRELESPAQVATDEVTVHIRHFEFATSD